MPIMLNDDNNQSVQTAVKTVNYTPKEFSSILTGNGINQGLLKSSVLAVGTIDTTSNNVKAILINERSNCTNKALHVHDDTRSYTVLHQYVSICGGYKELGGNQKAVLPMKIITDDFMTFEDVNGNTMKYKARMFLTCLYVYKGLNNHILPAYTIVVGNENNITDTYQVSYDCLYSTTPTSDPITDMIISLRNTITAHARSLGYAPTVDNCMDLAGQYNSMSMYDIIMSELALIKTPGVLKEVLTALSATSIRTLSHANYILNIVNIPFALYQSDILDVVKGRTPDEVTMLMHANMSLSLADTLSTMQNNTNQQIPELVGKKYTTSQLTLTTEQLAAIESASRITIVAAGAGTGKSSCILHRLQFMQENNCDMKQTFVLSFTKAAAGNIKKAYKECHSKTIAEFTHDFIDVILSNGTSRVSIVSHVDFVQKLRIRVKDIIDAKIYPDSTVKALETFIGYASHIDDAYSHNMLLNMLDTSLNPEAINILNVIKTLQCTSLEIDPIIFNTQLHRLRPNIEHIIIDESQDSNRLEFQTMLKMAILNNISVYIVGDCAQTLYEFRDADPKILNNLTKLFTTYDLSINHRSTQIILYVANLISNTMSTHKTTLRAKNVMQITQQAVDATVTMNTYSKVNDPATIKILDDYLEKHLGKNETIAVIARAGSDVAKLEEYLTARYGATYVVQNITSQRRNDITILSMLGDNLKTIIPNQLADWAEFENIIKNENIRINASSSRNSKYTQNGPSVNKITLDWLATQIADGTNIIARLNDPATHDKELRRLQMSMLDFQTDKNNKLQRVMDAKNAKLKTNKADIIICTVHGVKGLEYDHVACFINTESAKSTSCSDENKRIAYVALTRAKQTECVFCTREKLLKDFEAYRAAQP